MPNWCSNDISINISNAKQIDKVKELTFNEKGNFEFAKFIEIPEDVERDWMKDNVGSKWLPSDVNTDVSTCGTQINLHYNSAWSPVTQAIGTLSQLLDNNNIPHTIDEQFEEPGIGFMGATLFEDGVKMASAEVDIDGALYDYGDKEELEDDIESAIERLNIKNISAKEIFDKVEEIGVVYLISGEEPMLKDREDVIFVN